MSEPLEEMSAFFNHRALVYDEKHVEHIGGDLESKNIIASFLPPDTKTLVDLGVGTGLELAAIFERFPEIEVTGIDFAEMMLRQLGIKYPDKCIDLRCESYLTFDFGHSLYDAAISVMSLHHYDHMTKAALYKRIYDGLSHNGLYIECDYILSEHEHDDPQRTEDFYFSELARIKKEQGAVDGIEYHYDTPCSMANQIRMLTAAGFAEVKEVWRRTNTVILTAHK